MQRQSAYAEFLVERPKSAPRKSASLSDLTPARRRQLSYAAGVGALLVLLLGGAWWLWSSRMPKPTADAVTLAKFVGSPRFAALSADDQKPYLDAMRQNMKAVREAQDQGKLSDAQREAAMQAVFGNFIKKRLADYFALAPGADREAYLDKMIKDMQGRGFGGPGGRGGPGGGGPGGANASANAGTNGGGGRRDPAARIMHMMESTPPLQRAQMAQFVADMRARTQALGLPAPRSRF